MTENYINKQDIKTDTMRKVEIRFFSAIGGAILALSLTLLVGLIVARIGIQENLGIYSLLTLAVIIGIYFIFGAANRK